MTSNTSGSVDIISIGGEQVPNIADLENEEYNPEWVSNHTHKYGRFCHRAMSITSHGNV